jgi:hypothetical protein
VETLSYLAPDVRVCDITSGKLQLSMHGNTCASHWFFFFFWFVRLLALRHSWPIVPASGDCEDDCGEADGM